MGPGDAQGITVSERRLAAQAGGDQPTAFAERAPLSCQWLEDRLHLLQIAQSARRALT